ncbi:dihydromonapterin reductase [Marinobacterium lutimaris]|uniref:Dihydromonapterin reductase n=1 Tax=Marinobacterium lutimaris TaxID=568106 RepID=A0A1H6AND2_9GAMM|nr:dihydromonapterin reductase [Marinobacterium lutimaris]SEG49684.1 dihydromonapterin reductase / dihydrofolate reductase [Marinobacterium lutimaris]
MSDKPSILITGGAQRLGLHCAKRLVEEGYPVIITCRHLRKEWELSPLEGVEVILADFSTVDGIQALIDEIDRRKLTLRAIIHNASDWMDDSAGAQAMQQMMMVHVQAPYLINQAAKRWFEAEGGGDIIHMTDFIARQGSPRHIAYAASKAALENLTLSFAGLLAPGIKVNSIAPSMILFNADDDEAYRTKTLAKSALGIEPGAEVVFQAVRYLLDNPYVTGSCLELNGGRNVKKR